MNVLQINTLDKKGGAAKVAYSLRRELEKRGHETSMFVGRKYSDKKNVKILNDIRSFSGKVRRKLAYWLANDIDVFSSDHILKTPEFKSADIVHCHNLHGNYFNLGTLEKMSAIKPVVWTLHDMWPITAHCAHAFDGKINEKGFFACPTLGILPAIAWHNEKYLEKRKVGIYKNSNFHIVTPSKWLANKVAQSILGNKPLSVIHNGIDTNIFKPRSDLGRLRSDLGLPTDKRIILIVAKGGASNPWKGGNYAQNLIKAFTGDSRTFFVDLGGNIPAMMATRKAEQSSYDGPHLKVVSYVTDQDILAKYYSAADMLLYPSIADNCPLVVLEAQACGLPVVAFETGGIPELVDHQKTGYVARYKDIDDLIIGTRWMLSRSSTEYTTMREAVITKIISGFTLEKMTDQYLSLYKKEIENFNLSGSRTPLSDSGHH